MKNKELLAIKNHRTWNIPNQSWRFYQEWNNALFLHWEVDLDELKKFVPKELEIDLFEGKPWVSLVAFTMEKIRPKHLPYFPPISNFDEINIRTYIKSKHKTGVYFLSIEGGKKISCLVAKALSELPYRYSKIKRVKTRFESYNSEFNDSLDINYKIGKPIKEKEELDTWLTERCALFQDTHDSINEFEIHHLEWPIQELKLDKLNFNYPRFKNLIQGPPDRIHYSKGVNVLAWPKQKS